MRLVLNASSFVAEGLRDRGKRLLNNEALDLHIAEETWNETTHEFGRRIALLEKHGHLNPEEVKLIFDGAMTILATRVMRYPPAMYEAHFAEARLRIPRDPNDAPTVALALALDCGIWTNDRDFFGCGLPVWVTDTLQAHLQAQR